MAVQGYPASRLQSTVGEVDLLKFVLISCVSWHLRFVYGVLNLFNLLGVIIDEEKETALTSSYGLSLNILSNLMFDGEVLFVRESC